MKTFVGSDNPKHNPI